MKPEDQAVLDAQFRRGEDAERLLNDPLLKHVLESMEHDIISTLKALRPNNVEGRDVCWRELRAKERFQQKLRSYVVTGKQAKKHLKPLKDKS